MFAVYESAHVDGGIVPLFDTRGGDVRLISLLGTGIYDEVSPPRARGCTDWLGDALTGLHVSSTGAGMHGIEDWERSLEPRLLHGRGDARSTTRDD